MKESIADVNVWVRDAKHPYQLALLRIQGLDDEQVIENFMDDCLDIKEWDMVEISPHGDSMTYFVHPVVGKLAAKRRELFNNGL